MSCGGGTSLKDTFEKEDGYEMVEMSEGFRGEEVYEKEDIVIVDEVEAIEDDYLEVRRLQRRLRKAKRSVQAIIYL